MSRHLGAGASDAGARRVRDGTDRAGDAGGTLELDQELRRVAAPPISDPLLVRSGEHLGDEEDRIVPPRQAGEGSTHEIDQDRRLEIDIERLRVEVRVGEDAARESVSAAPTRGREEELRLG